MKKAWLWFAVALCPLGLGTGPTTRSSPAPTPVPHRSPLDVAVLPGGRYAVTANHTSHTASLVDLVAGKVLGEVPCGRKPAGVACTRDGRRAAVSNLWDGTVTLLEVEGTALRPVATVAVGAEPRGLVFAPDGARLYVTLAGAHEVVQFDWTARRVLRRWPAPAEPRRLALSADGRYLAAASARSGQVRCWDTATGKEFWERKIPDAFNLHGLAFRPDGRELVTAHCYDRSHAIAENNIREGWAIDNRLGRLTLTPDPRIDYWQAALDVRGKAVADPCAVAFSPRGDWLAAAAAGTHELLVFQARAIPWSPGEPGDFLDAALDRDDGKFRRVPLGGRPVAVAFAGEDQVVAANYLLDALQVVEARSGKLLRQIPLGGPARPSLARRGEAIFYDAGRSLHQWFSCHTCHPDGHTAGRKFDTLNDDSYGNAKQTPSLRGVAHTGPWTWHGWQDDLGRSVEKSMTETLFGPRPSADDVRAVVAFLETLDHPPNPHGTPSAAAERGRVIFHGKARCVRCHHGDHYTSPRNYELDVEPDGSPYDKWNPPSLRGLYDRGPFLHDGRADTLDELLRVHHIPEKLGGQALTAAERRDLIEFLKSL